MKNSAVSILIAKNENTLTPDERFVRDMAHVLRKMKAERLYHVDYEVAWASFQDKRYPAHRFSMFQYYLDSGYNSRTIRRMIHKDGIRLPYEIELAILLQLAQIFCVAQFGFLDGFVGPKCYDVLEFASMSKKEEFSSVWLRTNNDIFNSLYEEVEKKASDLVFGEQPVHPEAKAKMDAKKENVIPFKVTPDYRVVTVDGQNHLLTALRAEAFKILHELYEKGHKLVHQRQVLSKLSQSHQSETLKDLFRKCDLWNTVIVPKGRGMVELRLPQNSKNS